MTKVLVTGGAGYIGSHTLVELIEANLEPIDLDNLCNSSQASLQRVEKIAGKSVHFIVGDVRDAALLERVLGEHYITVVVHFAGLKAVGESVEVPLKYFDNNVYGSQVLLQAMANAVVYQLVFSSIAPVCGEPQQMLISEECPVGRPTNPFGGSK